MASQQGESTVAGEPPAIGRLGLSRYSIAGAVVGVVLVIAGAVLVLALGHSRHATPRTSAKVSLSGSGAAAGNDATQGAARRRARARRGGSAQTPTTQTHSAVQPLAGHAGRGGAKAGVGVAATDSSGGAAVGAAAEAPDPEEAKSFPAPASVHHSLANKPSAAAEEVVAPGAPSNAEVRAELKQMHAVERAAAKQQAKTLSIVPGGDSIGGSGQLPIPQGVPEVIQRVIAGANAITDFPYVFGGGHASFVSNSYDCSGSVSYALAAGGLLSEPETSGTLESWGAPGPGKWITVYANAGHVYMYVNIGGRWMRYDTVGRSGVFASRWQPNIRSNAGFVARHWPGL
ncbi:MAG TPA: hypothetical protein VGI76_04665 [Solirubrobacteraceae bacterium]